MKNSPDPILHRQREQQIMQHVEKLLSDARLRIDTTRGRRPVTDFERQASKNDRGVDLKRLMSEMGRPDRELQNQMPTGQSIDVTLTQKRWWFLTTPVGRLRVVSVPPTRELIAGQTPEPMDVADVRKVLGETPPPLNGVPSTVVVISTSGFSTETHELAERRADRTVILVEPNAAGGWTVWGPVETKALADLFDPEQEQEKRNRVREAIEENQVDLMQSGVAADKIATKTQLPIGLIEEEIKAYARDTAGLVAKRLDGRVVLFRQSVAPSSGGSDMPLVDRLKSLFSRRGEHEKKIAFLSERRAALSVQRDRAYEEMGTLEKQDVELRQQFKDTSGSITKRRLTSQLLQLRKDLERRQQLLTVLNQQINVVSTHLHNLELVNQGKSAKLPNSDEMASDAAAAEEMLANLEADVELAESVGGVTTASMSAEEQALFEELERDAGREPGEAAGVKLDHVPDLDELESPAKQKSPPKIADRAGGTTPRRSEPEAG